MSLQSHASRRVVSEFLQDLHPDFSAPFPKGVIQDEVAVAFGRRSITKLIDVLALEDSELPDNIREHALRVFNALLTTQEHKTDAINRGAVAHLTALIRHNKSLLVRKLSCQALESIAQILQGRKAIATNQGFESLTGALTTNPEEAAGALRQMSTSNDGVSLLNTVLDLVVPALVTLITSIPKEATTMAACMHAAHTLAGIATTDRGTEAELKHGVPQALVGLTKEGLSGHFRFEERTMDLMESTASGLEQIAHHPEGKTALRESQAIQTLASMLVHCTHHRPTMLRVTSALMGISVEKESKVPIMMYAGIELVKLVKGSPDEYLMANARSTLVSVSEHLEARTITQQLFTEKELISLLFKGPLPPTPPDFRCRVALPYGTKEDGDS